MNSVLLLLSLHRDRGKFCAWRERVHSIIIISYLDKNINQYYFWISIISISHTIQTTVSCANKQHLATDESAIKMEFSKMSIKTNSQSIGIEYIYLYMSSCATSVAIKFYSKLNFRCLSLSIFYMSIASARDKLNISTPHFKMPNSQPKY